MFEDSLFSAVINVLSTPSMYLGAAAGASMREIWKFAYQASSLISGVIIVGGLMKRHPRVVGVIVMLSIVLLALSGCSSLQSAKSEREITLTGGEYCEQKRVDLRNVLDDVRECAEDSYSGCEENVSKLRKAKAQYSQCRNASLDNKVLTHPANIFRSTDGN